MVQGSVDAGGVGECRVSRELASIDLHGLYRWGIFAVDQGTETEPKAPVQLRRTAKVQVRLRFERIYGSKSRYGEKPRQSPPGSPLVIDGYPLPGERVSIYLGQPVEEVYRTYRVARAGGFTLVRRNVLRENITAEDEAEALKQAQSETVEDDLARWDWYITILIERSIDVSDADSTSGRWFSLAPDVAIRAEREFLEYASYQADFLVDHLSKHIHAHFFAFRDVEDRVVIFAGEGAPFRVPQVKGGDVNAFTTSPIERCNVDELRAAMLELQREGKLAFAPLAPATLLKLVQSATTSDVKGRALEELVCKLFSTIPGLSVVQRIKTSTEEIDLGVFNNAGTGFLASEQAVILAECKNWSSKCGRDEFSILEKKAENRRERCSLCFLISWNGFACTIEKELLRSSRQRLVIVPLTGDDLKTAVANGDFNGVIESAWRAAVFT